MKNNIQIIAALLIFSLITSSCKMNTKEESAPTQETEEVERESTTADEEEEEELPILLGVQKRATLEAAPYDSWFAESYKEHTLDTATINSIKKRLASTEITLFMGTWCEDSQRGTPAFYKVLDLAGIDANKVQLITVSEEKDTPEGLEEGKNITNVPTIIFSKDGTELGRIVEYPIESLEKDMQKILTGQEYKHAYAE